MPNAQSQASDSPQANQSPQQATADKQINQKQAEQESDKDQKFPNTKLEESQIAPGMYRPLPEEDVLKWTAPSRPFKKHNKKYFSTVTVIALLVSMIFVFSGQLMATTVVISVVFLVYVLSVIPPQDVIYKITTYGIRIENNLYYWEELGRFWFDKKYDQNLVNIEALRFPGRIALMLGKIDKEVVKSILSEVLLNKKPEPTLYEKTSAWIQEKIPLDLEE